MKLSYKREDIILGFFVIFSISYPFITALLIFLEDVKDKKHETEELRAFYSFVLGLEECKRERAEELTELVSENLLKDMGGVDGLLRTCESYRRAYQGARAEEKVIKEGELLVSLIRKEKGMTQRLVSVRVYYEKGDESIKIKRLEYEKGS
ncbi:hypothetical protein IAE16_06400 [Hydrogenobacter sp. T-2]|uniref:hypothetical protein n=1 Tax=Pampinifervens diazotrophicum TaxID=1632018 RepID=UPI002B262211|nr:hypothetical protein [Hydrogenobacter sp. T-2]WPM31448.1 hypothetical protein IAE16_06400 [Hydrogenobacter sp. T-2]